MLSEKYDIEEFIEKIKNKDRLDMIYIIEDEIEEYEKHSIIRKLSNEKLDYLKDLLSLQYFIKTGLKPKLLSDSTFLKFKGISENLIAKNQFGQEVVDLFKI